MTPLLPMFTLGHTFKPASIHAGGLRYHGAGVILSQLMKDGYMEAVDIDQLNSFKAGVLFAQTEGIIPAPESCHAIAATIREALKCKETGEAKTILFNLSGHGFVDMAAYDQYFSGEMQNYHVSDEELAPFLPGVRSETSRQEVSKWQRVRGSKPSQEPNSLSPTGLTKSRFSWRTPCMPSR